MDTQDIYTIKLPKKYEIHRKQFQKVIDKALAICKKTKVDIRFPLVFSLNGRISKCWGYCEMQDTPHIQFHISISSLLFAEDSNETAQVYILLHELCHTVPDGKTHQGPWREATRKIESYTGIRIIPVAKPEQMGLPKNFAVNHYVQTIECTSCGYIYGSHIKKRYMDHPEQYSCAFCGGKLKKTADNDSND